MAGALRPGERDTPVAGFRVMHLELGGLLKLTLKNNADGDGGEVILRHHRRLGWVAWIDPKTRVVRQVVKTVRLDDDDAGLAIHPAMSARVSPGGTVAHPDGRAGRLFVGDELVGQVVTIVSAADGFVTVTDARGRVLLRRLFVSLVDAVVPAGEDARRVTVDAAAGQGRSR